MPVDLNATKIDPHDPRFEPMLRKLQGNILKGHGRDHVTLVFASFRGNAGAVRAGLSAVAARIVTSALAQRDQTEAFKASGTESLFGGVLLSAKGYRKLGFTENQIAGAFVEPPPNQFGAALSNFRQGMHAHVADLNDPPPSTWEAGYRDGKIDALFLLAHDKPNALQSAVAQLTSDLAGFADVLAVEHGNALRTTKGDGFENFGFLDGRSQPVYFSTDLADEGPTDNWDPSEPLGLALLPDVIAGDPDGFGSYMVFRKLEQDVRGFRSRIDEVADSLGLVGDDRARAGAMAVGRFEDGTPLAVSTAPQGLSPSNNDFRNDVDPVGQQCPFHAHIRKTNPRGDITQTFGVDEATAERSRRITRRGIPYGPRAADMSDRPTGGVGLLFMCFQSSISNQFAFMQKSWANKEDFLTGPVGVDPVIGQSPAGATPISQQWPTPGGPQGISFGQFVTLKGGEFFFAPSLPFFKSLAP